MSGYISEFNPYGSSSQEFIEIALPQGTDPSGYMVQIYMSNGELFRSFPLGPSTGTMAGHDVYVVDQSTPGFPSSDSTGNLYPDDAIALVDDSGQVLQFVSYFGNTVTATEGPAAGQTSTSVGNPQQNGSLQSDDGGQTYYGQSDPNSGSIPACYAPGTLIATPLGPTPVEALRAGDAILSAGEKEMVVRWVWSGEEPLDSVETTEKPVLIRASALGRGRPAQDLIVSGQHRIVVGAFGQFEDAFEQPAFVPAKALTDLPRIRFMAGKSSIIWHHFLCDDHAVAFASGAASESLLLGPVILRSLSWSQRADVAKALRRPVDAQFAQTPCLPCFTVGESRRRLRRLRRGIGLQDDRAAMRA